MGNSFLKNQSDKKRRLSTSGIKILDSMDDVFTGISKEESNLNLREIPGYKIMDYVKKIIDTDFNPVPIVKTKLNKNDIFSATYVRSGFKRDHYLVSPGLYGVGNPDKDSEVIVTANYKLTFDMLRKELEGIDAWILVLDTKGVNVWCAAGKGTFSTKELLFRIKNSKLEKLVDHKRLILPQLGATSVSAWDVKKESGFRVIYGPIRAYDLPGFLNNGNKADEKMRNVTFTLHERLILTPVEMNIALKPCFITAFIILIISGIGPEIFSLSSLMDRGIIAFVSMIAGTVSGTCLTPVLLPFIPAKAFALKGIITGVVGFFLLNLIFLKEANILESISLFIFTSIVSSYFAMNFTGSTPYTSPSGVEKEMKIYIPIQAIGILVSSVLWIYSAFV